MENELTAALAVAGSEIDDLVRRAHHAFLMLDDDDRIAGVAEAFKDLHQPRGVAGMQADARLVEDVERVDQARAEATRQVHPLRLAAGERAGRPVECEVTEADLVEVTQPLPHFAEDEAERFVGLRSEPLDQAVDDLKRVADRQSVKIGKRQPNIRNA